MQSEYGLLSVNSWNECKTQVVFILYGFLFYFIDIGLASLDQLIHQVVIFGPFMVKFFPNFYISFY